MAWRNADRPSMRTNIAMVIMKNTKKRKKRTIDPRIPSIVKDWARTMCHMTSDNSEIMLKLI